MSRLRNVRILLLCTALLIGAGVWVASSVLRSTGDDYRAHQADAARLLTSMPSMQTGTRGFELTGREDFLEPFRRGRTAYVRNAGDLRAGVDGRSAELFVRADEIAQRWQVLAVRSVELVRGDSTEHVTVAGFRERKAIFDDFTAAQQDLAASLDGDRDAAGSQAEFVETMQLTENETEAHVVVRRHLERSIPGSSVIILNRDNSANRLLPSASVDDPDLAARIEGAQPRSCLAVRVGRLSERATDALTGLPNRRSIDDTLKRMIAQASRTMQPMSAVMIDVDHFKTINDLHGHEAGDQALAGLGALLTDSLRDSDFAGRQGGEEFILLAPATDAAGAATLAENLRVAIEKLQIPGLDHPLSASFGVGTFPDIASNGSGLLRMADRALYAAKENGRNRVEVAATPSPEQRV